MHFILKELLLSFWIFLLIKLINEWNCKINQQVIFEIFISALMFGTRSLIWCQRVSSDDDSSVRSSVKSPAEACEILACPTLHAAHSSCHKSQCSQISAAHHLIDNRRRWRSHSKSWRPMRRSSCTRRCSFRQSLKLQLCSPLQRCYSIRWQEREAFLDFLDTACDQLVFDEQFLRTLRRCNSLQWWLDLTQRWFGRWDERQNQSLLWHRP